MHVSSNLKTLDSGARWRGFVDGIDDRGILRGWAFDTAHPSADLGLDLYIDDAHVATFRATQPHSVVDRIIGASQPTNCAFQFDFGAFRSEGALNLLRRHGGIPAWGFAPGICLVCIAGTRHALPQARATGTPPLPPAGAEAAMLRAAARQLRVDLARSGDADGLGSLDRDILLRTSPLLSAAWYGETFGEVAMTGLDPVEHFRRFGTKLERPASPWFDTQAYLAAAPEARAAMTDPVTHYELHGHGTWWPGDGKFRPSSGETSEGADGARDHALLIHLYHLDTVPDLQRLVAQFPEGTDIFVSVPENSPDHDPRSIAELFPRAKEIFAVPNLGQDVAAFLGTVRRLEGRGYRFFCKVHSKKGNKYPETWRRVMFDALAATPGRVAQTIGLLRADRRVLMAGPSEVWFDGAHFALNSANRLGALMSRMGFGAGSLGRDWAFFGGTCFWVDAELARRIAEAVPAELFRETVVSPDGQTSHAVERLFSLVASCAGGRIATLDGRDWDRAPVVLDPRAPCGLRMAEGETPKTCLERHFRHLSAPRIVDGTAARPSRPSPDALFGTIDGALHGTIDVLASCWMGQAEPVHDGLAQLRTALADRGLTSAFLVATRPPRVRMQTLGCANVFLDSLLAVLPPHAGSAPEAGAFAGVPEAFGLSLLRSECLFRREEMPAGAELAAALRRVDRVAACWRQALAVRQVKLFLIWGDTAPKSRLFIHLCEEMGIEYQIIERGHFPGTMSIDPSGQFGTGVRTKLIEHVAGRGTPADGIDARFDAIREWYDTQRDNAAYSSFQKHATRDVEIMQKARAQGRPVILAIGGNDQGAGVTGPEPARHRLNWFGTSDNAFTILRRVVSAKFPDALLVLRPHPSHAPQQGDFVLVARKAALDDLIDAADLCITVGSTARAICLLKEKPLLSLGLSEINGQDAGEAIVDETHLLAALRQHVWTDFANPFPSGANRRLIVEMFDRHLIGVGEGVPTRHGIVDLANLLASRIERMKTGFLQSHAGREEKISQAMFADVRDRGRALFPVDPRAFAGRGRPRISVVLPIYGDFEGTRICFDQLAKYQDENGYRVITVWDRGPDLRLRDLCLEYARTAGFTCLENRENVGFSGTVNSGILQAGRDDVILLNSDTIPCGDWALRLQDAAYAHPRVGSAVPLSNNATIYNLAFPSSTPLPDQAPVAWVESLDKAAKAISPCAVEMPVSHGYCTYVRRSIYDRLGLYSEMKFDKGHSEDNEFSLRVRMAGYFCVCSTNVVMGHAGSTSFGDEVETWKARGRQALRQEFSHYFDEIRLFFDGVDPLAIWRERILRTSSRRD